MKWRIRKLYVPRYDKNLYIPEYKGIFFWKSFKFEEYDCSIRETHDMYNKYELVHSNFDLFIGFEKLEYAEEMISFYENNYLPRLKKDTKPKIINVTCKEEN
ncbi:MAG: hypothetical protein IKP65_01460 [Alphaproteobacteria bacterium]|nr:hypothetical protein [Alphaproteobacteria bacterium]